MMRLLLAFLCIAVLTSIAAVGCSTAEADEAAPVAATATAAATSERLLVIETKLETINDIGRYAVVPLMIAIVFGFVGVLRAGETRITGEIRQVAAVLKEQGERIQKVEVDGAGRFVDRLTFAQEVGALTRRIDAASQVQAHG